MQHADKRYFTPYENAVDVADAAKISGLKAKRILELIKRDRIFYQHDKNYRYFISRAVLPLLENIEKARQIAGTTYPRTDAENGRSNDGQKKRKATAETDGKNSRHGLRNG